MTFKVELRPAGGWRVVDDYGHIAETGITDRMAALEMARLFTENPELCQGMLAWHTRKTLAGPDDVQRPIKTGGKAAARRKAPSARRTVRTQGR